MANYFFVDNPGFGRISWVLMLAWVGALGAGVYLYNNWQERNVVRRRFFRQFGLGLSILGAGGLLLLALKAFGLPYVSWRIWTYLVALAMLGFLAWAAWFYTRRFPQLMAATQAGKAGRGGARTYSSNGPRAVPAARPPAPPRPVPTTGRREARRDKKRKSR